MPLFFVVKNFLDPDTKIGVSVAAELEIIGVMATDISKSGSLKKKKVGGDVS